MEIRIVGKMVVRCNECGEENISYAESFEENISSYDRSMGAETEHDFFGQCECCNCGKTLQYHMRFFEYPEGILDYSSEDSYGCEILEIPEATVN